MSENSGVHSVVCLIESEKKLYFGRKFVCVLIAAVFEMDSIRYENIVCYMREKDSTVGSNIIVSDLRFAKKFTFEGLLSN